VPLKPILCPRPTPKRLPERKAVTIVIGLLAEDGIVVAADTQETIGSMKIDESKVLVANKGTKRQKAGALIVSGAGDGGYLDTINQEICDCFLSNKWDKKSFTNSIKRQLKQFHADHIIPFSMLPSHERPELSLVLGGQIGTNLLLLESDRSTIRPCRNYAAVGIGHTHARAMLRRYWVKLNTVKAASLAAYIMFNVKNNVDGCGNETQIVILKDGHAEYLSDRNIFMLEHSFREYQADEVLMLHFALGLDLRQPDMDSELVMFGRTLKQTRRDIEMAQRFELSGFRAGVRPVDQPQVKPLTSEKLEL
jgi:hypothetical protein